MTNSILNFKINGSDLISVPAVHFHYAFAQEVNRLCRNPDTRPDAIAVELGPETAAAARKWLVEIREKSGEKKQLPCLLGLFSSELRQQQKKLPFFYERTKNDSWVKILERGNPADMGSLSLLPLSSTDSIIEAIRCGIELDIPVYGVDIEHIDTPKYSGVMLQDPAMAAGKIEKYVLTHQRYVEAGRDDKIDDQREKVMASRLKAILEKHRRVLFTCGMGHWRRIQCHLDNLHIVPDDCIEEDAESDGFFRAIIHPVLAFRFLDKFPKVAEVYESQRIPAHISGNNSDKRLGQTQLFSEIFNCTCAKYFKKNGRPEKHAQKHHDLYACYELKHYLLNLCAVKQLVVPDMMTTLRAAGSMMSERFCEELTARLMEIDWASPVDFPELPVIGKAKKINGRLEGVFKDLHGIQSRSFKMYVRQGLNSKDSYIEIPWEWMAEKHHQSFSGGGFLRTLPAWDHILTGLSIEARKKYGKNAYHKITTPFEGSFYEGLDIKAFMKSCIKGEDRIYVRDRRLKENRIPAKMFDFVPVVFLFDTLGSRTGRWVMHEVGLSHMHTEHVSDHGMFTRAIKEKGDYAVSAINFSEPSDRYAEKREFTIKQDILKGITVFIPVYFNGVQEARWLEDTGYEKNPMYSGGGILGFMRWFHNTFDIDLCTTQWPESLIRMAIPFAEKELRVVAPDGYYPSGLVYAEANARGINIELLPHSLFPGDQIEKASHQYCLTPLDKEGRRFPKAALQMLDMDIDSYKKLMPDNLLNYGTRQ